MAKLGLSAPWDTLYREIMAMFGDDPEINVVFDEENYTIKMYVDNSRKAEALMQLIEPEREFGNVKVKIEIIPPNDNSAHIEDLFNTAFENNPVFSYSKTIEGIMSNPLHYIVFRNKVVQFYNDNLGDVNGLCSTLYQDIAKDIFGDENGVFYCTDIAGVPYYLR